MAGRPATKNTFAKRNTHIETGRVVASHLWFNWTKGFQKLGVLQPGDQIEFDARVKRYTKGYFGWDEWKRLENPPRADYKLSHPTRIKKLESDNEK